MAPFNAVVSGGTVTMTVKLCEGVKLLFLLLGATATEAQAPPKPNPEVRFYGKPKALSPKAITHDWTSFLGPFHNGTSTETKLLHDWPKTGPVRVWEMRKGTGYSSPAIAGDRLVYFHRVGTKERVECLHPENGSKYWEFSYDTAFEDRYGYNNGPRSSPVIDGDRVYTYGAEGKLHCLRLQTGQVCGSATWRRNLRCRRIFRDCDYTSAGRRAADHQRRGSQRASSRGPGRQDGQAGLGQVTSGARDYSTPVAATIHGKRKLLVFAGGESKPPRGGLLSLDAATGSIDFAFPWRSRSYESVNAASPVVAGNQVFVSASYRTGGALLNVLPDGKHTVAWTSNEIGTHWNTAIHKDGYLYAFDGRNEPDAALVCIELKTGKVMWRVSPEWDETLVNEGTERKAKMSTYRGTLLSVDGRFLCLGEMGHLLWLDLTPQGYKELARTWLFLKRRRCRS
ncbi:MAG: PQQ-binding-like beta-propeller repeat protein [Bryobacteraceae bacterium]